MLKKLFITFALACSVCCASFNKPTFAIPFANQLRLAEEHELVQEFNFDIGGDELAVYIPKLQAIAAEIGYDLMIAGQVLTPEGQELWGYTDVDNKIIYLSLNQSGNNFVHTFIHELSHAMQPMPQSIEGQVFAETVACIVTEQLGVKAQKESFAYVARFDNHLETLDRYSVDIDNLVKFFLSKLK